MQIDQGTTEVATPEVTSGPAGGESDGEHGQGDSEAPEHGETQVAEYTPNYKFKAYGREVEIEEWARQYIKDKETEERFRGLYSKSQGFDVLKEKYTSRSQEYKDIKTQFSEVQQTMQQKEAVLSELRHLRDNDLHGFLKACQVPPEKLIDYVQKHLEYMELPADKRAEVDAAREAREKAYRLEQEVTQLRTSQEQVEIQNHAKEFEGYLEHPEVSAFAEKYDTRAGQEGAFREAVIQYGDMVFHKTGKTLSPLEAIRAVYKQYKPFLTEAQQAAAAQQQAEVAPEGQQERQRPAVIPTIGRGSAAASPARKSFKTLDDLKKHVKSLEG